MSLVDITCGCGCASMPAVTKARRPCRCGCECCDNTPTSSDDEIAELRRLLESVEARLAELGD